jgi:lysozyme
MKPHSAVIASLTGEAATLRGTRAAIREERTMIRRHIGEVSVLALAVVTACGGPSDGSAEKIGWTSNPITVCAGGTTVEGVDVSEFQGSINWTAVHNSGRDFAITRVSDGTGHLDPTFKTNWAGIKAAGMVRGVYQFFEGTESGTAQADLLIQQVGTLEAGDLPPVADVEVLDGASGSQLISNLAAWVAEIKAKTGRTPIIYTAPGFWNGLPSTGQFGSEVLWVANWQVNCPDTPTPWTAWKFWQYDDGTTTPNVPGISGGVDKDKFNGSLAQLQSIGGPLPYGAQFVGQSFPLASTALTMVEGQTIPSYIELKNVGTKTWDSNTKIGTTQPRDRKSAFADSTWLAPNRLAAVKGTVAPGGTYKFTFDLHAPSTPGTFTEYFGVVQEGVAWFSDPGQGGPPDNDLEVQVKVIAPEYRGDFKNQSFPLAPAALAAHQGDVVSGYIELTNSGTQPWKAGTTKLAPIPRDKASPFADKSWLSTTRISSVAADVAPGAVGRFDVTLDANTVGNFTVEFGLVEEGVSWFADPTLGGGPADGFLKVQLDVVAKGAPLPDGGVVASDGGTTVGGGSSGGSSSGGGADDGGGEAGWGNGDTGSSGGCSVSPAGGGASPARGGMSGAWAVGIGVLFALVGIRRRSR